MCYAIEIVDVTGGVWRARHQENDLIQDYSPRLLNVIKLKLFKLFISPFYRIEHAVTCKLRLKRSSQSDLAQLWFMCVGFKLIAVWYMSQCESGGSSCVVPNFTERAGRGLYCFFFHWEFKPAVMPLFLAMFVFHCFHRLDMDINERLATSGKLIENGRGVLLWALLQWRTRVIVWW